MRENYGVFSEPMKALSTSQSNAISIIRVVAMILIVSCHITQGYDQQIAFILNVGVQIFFLISGFLYGKVEISSVMDFYKKRVVKIYIPFIIVVLLFASVYAIFGVEQVYWKQLIPYVFNLQAFATPIDGFNHMWFLTVIMICYLVTPIAKNLLKNKPYVFVSLLLLVSVVEFVFVQKMYSIAAWIILYLFGMCIGQFDTKIVNTITTIVSGMGLAILMVFFQLSRLTDPMWAHYSVWLHCVLAIFIFGLLYTILTKLDVQLPKCLQFVNNISYEVYLVHHILILGPFSLLFVTSSKTINILLILIITFVLSYALNQLMNLTKRIL